MKGESNGECPGGASGTVREGGKQAVLLFVNTDYIRAKP